MVDRNGTSGRHCNDSNVSVVEDVHSFLAARARTIYCCYFERVDPLAAVESKEGIESKENNPRGRSNAQPYPWKTPSVEYACLCCSTFDQLNHVCSLDPILVHGGREIRAYQDLLRVSAHALAIKIQPSFSCRARLFQMC